MKNFKEKKEFIILADVPPIPTMDRLEKYKAYCTQGVIEVQQIKIFDKDNMIFGETNLIMTFFDHICDYIFGDFITTYNVLDTLFKSFIQ